MPSPGIDETEPLLMATNETNGKSQTAVGGNYPRVLLEPKISEYKDRLMSRLAAS